MGSKVSIIGMPGSGKTTVGKALKKELDMKFFDMDDYIIEKTGQTIAQLFEKGEEHFRDIETEACRELMKLDNVLISTGGGIVKRKENIDILKNDGIIIFIDRPVENILQDVDVSSRPLLKDGKEKVLKLYEERYELYKKYADIIVLNDNDLSIVIDKIKEIIISKEKQKCK